MSHELTPYENTTQRQGDTKGAIMFEGYDKQAQFSQEAQGILDDFDSANTERKSPASKKILAELAVQQAAAANNWDEDRINAALSEINKSFADK